VVIRLPQLRAMDVPQELIAAGGELDEKANMKPADIGQYWPARHHNSATSQHHKLLIRIQGWMGVPPVKDGLPLYAGFSGGLGLLQTPPLDLIQLR
jgi:iron complex outermembrane receptor protein